MTEKMEMVSVNLPKVVLDEIEKLVESGEFPTKSDFIRYAVITVLRIWKLTEIDEVLAEFVDLKAKVHDVIVKIKKLESKAMRGVRNGRVPNTRVFESPERQDYQEE